MPHLSLKFFSRVMSSEQKTALVMDLSGVLTHHLGCADDVISIAFEQIEPTSWHDLVYKPEIQGQQDRLVKVPHY